LPSQKKHTNSSEKLTLFRSAAKNTNPHYLLIINSKNGKRPKKYITKIACSMSSDIHRRDFQNPIYKECRKHISLQGKTKDFVIFLRKFI